MGQSFCSEESDHRRVTEARLSNQLSFNLSR